MKNALIAAIAVGCLTLGVGAALAAKEKPPGIDVIRGKAPKEAAMAALAEAEKLAGDGTWERLGVARVYYLSGDKERGQALIDAVLKGKNDKSDWQRIGQIYADAGENERASEFFDRALAADPKDDTAQAEIGAWYIRIGQREKGEELLAKALKKHPDELWHYIRAAEGLLGVPSR